jgi:hypothetical protein
MNSPICVTNTQASLAQSITHCRISMLSQLGGIFDALANNDFLKASTLSEMHCSCSSRVKRLPQPARSQG